MIFIKHEKITCDIAFWLLYISSILVYLFRVEQYERPFVFFILLAFAVAVLSIQIINAQNSKKHIIYILSKIILVAITIEVTQLLVYSNSLIGTDPWYHHLFIYKIASNIPLHRLDYSGMQIYYYLVGKFCLLTGFTEKAGLITLIGIPYTSVIILVIYKLGRLIRDYKLGLFSALIMSIASMFLYFGIELLPSSFGMMMVMIMVYLSIEISRNKKSKWNIVRYLIIAGLFVLTVFTNSLMVLITIIIFGLMWLGILIYDKSIKKVIYQYSHYFYICLIFAFGIGLWWIFGTGQIGAILRAIGNKELIVFFSDYIPYGKLLLEKGLLEISSYLGDGITDASYWANAFTQLTSTRFYDALDIINQYQSTIPFGESIIKKIPFILYVGLGMFGMFWLIKNRKNFNCFSFAITISALIILITNIINLLSTRYFFLSRHVLLTQIMLVPIAGYGIYQLNRIFSLTRRFGIKNINVVCVFIITFVMALSSFISPYLNIDNRELTPNSSYRLVFTDEELKGIDEVCVQSKSSIYTDWYTGYYIYHIKRITKEWKFKDIYDVSESFIFRDYSKLPEGSVVLIRDEVNEHPIIIAEYAYKIPYNVGDRLIEQGYKVIYNKNSVVAYQK